MALAPRISMTMTSEVSILQSGGRGAMGNNTTLAPSSDVA